MNQAAPQRPTGSKTWATVRLVVSLALAGLALYIVAGRRDELSAITTYLDKIDYDWIGAAVVMELLSIFCFALIQRRLARSGKVPMSPMALFGITLAGNSINNSLPAGPAWASYFAFRQYRRLGADSTLSAWILVGVFLSSSAALAILAGCGLLVGATTGSGSFGVTNTVVAVVFGAFALAGLVAVFMHRRGTLELAGTRILTLTRRVVRRPRSDPAEVAREIAGRLSLISPSRGAIAAVFGWAGANWILDLAALVVSFWAVGVAVPWSGILLAYGAGQLAANLPITPGGLGVVEGSLAVALVAYGGSQASTVTAVLLYRLVSFWMPLPLGWSAWLLIHYAERRAVRTEPVFEAVVEETRT